MEILLTNYEYVMNPGARGGLPQSYLIANVQVTANNQDEVRQLIMAMQQWADGTLAPVVQSQNVPLVIPVVEKETPKLEEIRIDLITGLPR
jgi:hypothetical protein